MSALGKWQRVALIFVALLTSIIFAVACGSDDSSGGGPAGTEGQSCFPNDTCNAGLTCLSHLCVNKGMTDAGPSDTTLDVADAPSVDTGSSCAAGSVMCNGSCVPSNADHCGTACTVCTAPNFATATCNNGVCGSTCLFLECGGQCVDSRNDNANCGSCGRNCQNACTSSACIPIPVVNTISNPMDLAVNATTLYWTAGFGGQGSVQYEATDAGMPASFVSNQWLTQLALDNSHLYFVQDGIGGDVAMNAIGQVSLADAGAPLTIATSTRRIDAVALNSTTVFYMTKYDGTIWSVPIGGTSAPVAVVTGQSNLYAIAADDSYVYWAANPGDGLVYRATVTGATPTLLATAMQSSVRSIAVDATTLYFSNFSMADAGMTPPGIYAVPIAGGSPTLLGNYGTPLRLDGAFIYFGQYGQQFAIAKMAKTGGAQITLASAPQLQPDISGIGASDVYVMLISGQSGSIVRTPK